MENVKVLLDEHSLTSFGQWIVGSLIHIDLHSFLFFLQFSFHLKYNFVAISKSHKNLDFQSYLLHLLIRSLVLDRWCLFSSFHKVRLWWSRTSCSMKTLFSAQAHCAKITRIFFYHVASYDFLSENYRKIFFILFKIWYPHTIHYRASNSSIKYFAISYCNNGEKPVRNFWRKTGFSRKILN